MSCIDGVPVPMELTVELTKLGEYVWEVPGMGGWVWEPWEYGRETSNSDQGLREDYPVEELLSNLRSER